MIIDWLLIALSHTIQSVWNLWMFLKLVELSFLFLTYTSVSFGVCIEFVVVTAIREMSWHFALHHVNYEMSNFQLAQLLLPWNICCVENKIEENAWRPLWTTYPKLRNLAMNGFSVLANKCAEEDANASRQLAVHSLVRMPWELPVKAGFLDWKRAAPLMKQFFQYCVKLIDSLNYLSIWSFEKVISLTKHSANERIYSVMWTQSCLSSVT